MTPILPRAGKFFEQGDFRKALSLYQSCLSTLKQYERPPQSLLTFCETRVRDCRLEIAEARAKDKSATGAEYEIFFESPDLAEKLPYVSIVIPHFNSAGLIYQALDSIAAQNFREVETLVIDDCSDDGTLSADRLATYPHWMRLKVIELSKNGGPAHCRNLGISLAQGRGVCLLDADDYLDTNSLESRWKLVNGDIAIAAAFSTMTYVDFRRHPLGSVILGNAESFSYTDFLSNKFPCSALLFRRRALLPDPFDENLICGEDYECFSRIAQRGGLYRFAPNGTILYRQHGDSLTHKDALLDLQRRVEVTRNVHGRELSWSSIGYAKNLPEAIIVKEYSLRGFPVACIYAMRHDAQKALEIGNRLDADAVASQPAKQVADSIRFFLTREEFKPSSEVPRLLENADKACLLGFFNDFFKARHRTFVVNLLTNLLGRLPAAAATSLPNVLGAPLACIGWKKFITDGDDWNGYLLLMREDDVLTEASSRAARAALSQRGDLDGIYMHRLHFTGADSFVDTDSIAPMDPDSRESTAMGGRLRPAMILHELAARPLRAWLRHNAATPLQDVSSVSESFVEGRVLAAAHALRLKVIGGLPGCYVQHTVKAQQS